MGLGFVGEWASVGEVQEYSSIAAGVDVVDVGTGEGCFELSRCGVAPHDDYSARPDEPVEFGPVSFFAAVVRRFE